MEQVIKIKEFKVIPLTNKNDIEYMRLLKAKYEEDVSNPGDNPDYVKIADQVFKLEEKKKKEISILMKQLSKDKQKEEVQLKRRTSDLDLQEIIDTYDFYMSHTGGLCWYYRPTFPDEYGNREWQQIKKETLLANFPATDVYIRGEHGEPDYSSFKEFTRMLSDQERVFTAVIQSYTKKTGNGKLNIMNKNFALPTADGSTDYHWMFDAIFESISGGAPGCKDTFDHLQCIVFGKYIHPDNIFLPCPFINDDGSSGKGLFGSRFLMTLFQGNVADNCNIEHLTGKFNSAIAGRAVIYINETARAKVDVEKVKSFIGSPTFMVEKKFETPYSCDNTGLVISVTNEKSGGITLSGTHSDRRYSIFSTKETIFNVVIRYFACKEGKTITVEEAQNWIEETGQWLLCDPYQIGKWINAMVEKHGDVNHVRANKGDAYKTLIDRQRAGWLQTVETVFTEPGFVYIRDQLLQDLVKEFNKSEKFIPGRNKFKEDVERLCVDRGIRVKLIARASIKNSKTVSQRTVWATDLGYGSGSIIEDEDMFGSYDTHGRWIWAWRG
jgi:hypothetical protein